MVCQSSRWLATVALSVVLCSAPARAQMPVIDPANLAQSVIQAGRALEQIHNQVRQIEQQAAMLARDPLQLSPELSKTIGEARALFDEAQGIAFDMDRVGDDVRVLYPETWKKFDLAAIGARSDQWLAEDRASLERAMKAQAQAATALRASQSRIERALSASAGAQGQTSAVQAGNQLLGVNAAELAQIHALLIAQGRALTTEKLERVAREERARDIQRRAFPAETSRAPQAARPVFGE